MSKKSSIEWTDATWNPSTGCTKISPGCKNCYIERTPPMRIAGRKFVNGKIPLLLHEDRLDKPLHWREPRMIFVNSMSDLFHEEVPDEFIDKVFAVMALCPQHTFQVLTKRSERMQQYVADSVREGGRWDQLIYDGDFPWPDGVEIECPSILETAEVLPNVWLGVSVENKKHGWPRVFHLRNTPAAVRFFSVEPLLEDVTPLRLDGIHLVIAGGESGPGARPMHPQWVRSIRDQCVAACVPFFFKQWGEYVEDIDSVPDEFLSDGQQGKMDHWWVARDGQIWKEHDAYPKSDERERRGITLLVRVGKKNAGRLLDGVEWNQMPERQAVTA